MSTNASNSFETKWWMEVTEALQRRGSLLRPTVDVVNNVQASTYKFPTSGSFTSQKNKATGADLTPNNTAHGTVTATLADYHASDLIQDLDQFKTSVQFRNIYTRGITSRLGRDIDTDIIASLAAGATTDNTTNSNAAAAVSVDLVAEMVSILKSNDAWELGEMALVITPDVERAMLGVAALTSGDFVSENVTDSGNRKRIMGLDVIVHSDTALGEGAGTHTCYAYPKQAIGMAMGKDISTRVDFIPLKDAHQVMGKASFGSITKQADAIAKMLVTIS